MIDFLLDEDVDNLKFLADRYHWSSEKKRSTDYQYLENAYHASLPVIGSALNDAHKIHRDCKYWETVIGYWLVVYISVMFDRFEMLKDIHLSSRINEYANDPEIVFPPPKDVSSFVDLAAFSDSWNFYVFNILRNEISWSKAPSTRFESAFSEDDGEKNVKESFLKKFSAKVLLRNILSKSLGVFGGFDRQKIVFHLTYFSAIELLKIEWQARGKLSFAHFHNLSNSKFSQDLSVRSRFRRSLCSDNAFSDEFIGFLLKNTVNFIPLSYLEEYSSRLNNLTNVNPRPKLIFTANAHFSDDSFKIWSAEMRFQGSKLVLSEHGGSFPAKDYLFRFEERVSDFYIVGWPKSHEKHKPLPLSSYINKSPVIANRTGENLILITFPGTKWAIRPSSQPISYRAISVVNMIDALFDGVDNAIKERTLVKLLNAEKKWDSLENAYIGSEKKSFAISREPLNKLFNIAKVLVCTYPQTTYTEAFLSGVPVILLYDPKISAIEDSASEIVLDMIRYKMCFYDPVGAAEHLNSVWHDPLAWWNSDDILRVRQRFSDYTMLSEPKKTESWTSFFISAAGDSA